MVLSDAEGKHDRRPCGDHAGEPPLIPFRLFRQFHEAGDVLRRDLHPARGPKRVDPEKAEILIEVAKPWRDHDRFDPGLLRSLDQRRHRAIARRIVVASLMAVALATPAFAADKDTILASVPGLTFPFFVHMMKAFVAEGGRLFCLAM